MNRWLGLVLAFASACGGSDGLADLADATAVDAAAADASSYQHLLDELGAADRMVLGYRVSGQWNDVGLPGAWLVRTLAYEATGTDAADYTITVYVDDPGPNARTAGEVLCQITGSLTVAEVTGYDVMDRVKVIETIATNECTGTVDVTDETIVEVVERAESGAAELVADWHPLDRADEAAFPGWVWTEGGRANPYRTCPDSARLAGREYCAPRCDWDYLNPPSGSGCVE